MYWCKCCNLIGWAIVHYSPLVGVQWLGPYKSRTPNLIIHYYFLHYFVTGWLESALWRLPQNVSSSVSSWRSTVCWFCNIRWISCGQHTSREQSRDCEQSFEICSTAGCCSKEEGNQWATGREVCLFFYWLYIYFYLQCEVHFLLLSELNIWTTLVSLITKLLLTEAMHVNSNFALVLFSSSVLQLLCFFVHGSWLPVYKSEL